jgi:5-methylthioadenosine/S-adenosylhomocysteine deaminase
MPRDYNVSLPNPTATQVLITSCALLDPDQPGRLLHDQDILISGERIAAIGPHGTLMDHPFHVTKVIDGQGCLAMPGLINAHTHSLENVLKATSPSLPLELWLIPLFSDVIEWSPRFVYLSTLLGAIEMLKSGTTAVLDHLWTADGVSLPYLDATMQAYRDAGIRAAVAPSIEDQDLMLEAGRKRGMTFPSHPFIDRFSLWPAIDEQIMALEQFIAQWHLSAHGRLRCLVGPSGIHWCSPYLMQACLDLASRYQTGMHLHAVETQVQAKVIQEMLGQGGIAYLQQAGVLKADTSLAHAIWLEDGDLEMLASTRTTVVHNPVSNLRLGSGRFPLVEARKSGVRVALGSDGSASNDTQNMFGVLKMTGLMHNQPDNDYRQWPQPLEILEMTTLGGAAALGQSAELGQLAPGYLADLVLLNLDSTPFLPLRDPYLHLVYCEHGESVQTSIVHGAVVVEQGIVATVDEYALRHELHEYCKSTLFTSHGNFNGSSNTWEVLTSLDTLRRLILQQQCEA